MLLATFAAIPLLIWVYLIAFRGGFWRVSKNSGDECELEVPARHVVAVIPARNEAAGISETVNSILGQNFPAPIEIVLADDGSTDGTGEIARAAAERAGKASCLKILQTPPLPSGWTGKLWALAQGIAYARSAKPDYFLFTDGDICHGRDTVRTLAARAETGNYDLVSYMVKLTCSSIAEKALIPAFVYFFFELYPPAWVESTRSKMAAAAGGCILIRQTALDRIGGVAAIRGEMIDDCALARAVKRTGGRIWMGLTEDAQSLRSYGTFAEIGRMISRSAFNQLHHSLLLLALTIAGLFFTYLLPPALLFTGVAIPTAMGAMAYALMAGSYVPMLRVYGRSPAWGFALPFIALFYLGATVHSAIQYWRGRGGKWKGRIQDMRPG